MNSNEIGTKSDNFYILLYYSNEIICVLKIKEYSLF